MFQSQKDRQQQSFIYFFLKCFPAISISLLKVLALAGRVKKNYLIELLSDFS